MRLMIVLVLLGATVVAEDPQGNTKLVVDIQGRSVAEVAKIFGQLYKTKIEVDPAFTDKKITLRVKATMEEIVGLMAKQVGGAVFVERDGARTILPAWKVKLLRKLEQTRLYKVEWKEGDLTAGGAIQYLRAVTGLNFVVDEYFDADTAINAKLDDVPARTLVDLIAKQAEGAWRLRFGVIFFADADRVEDLPDRVSWQDEKLLQRRFDTPFDNVAFNVATQYCQAASGLKIVLSPKAKEIAADQDVSLHVSQLTFANTLALILPPLGLKAELDGEVVHIKEKDE